MIKRTIEKIRAQFANTNALYKKALRGGIWVGASFALGKVLSTVQQIILARILIPEDFGVYGMALLAIASLEIFTQTGIKPALIQAKEVDEKTLNTAWTFTIIRNLILFAGLQAFAPLAAWFFESPGLNPILRVLAFYVLLEGFVNIGTVLFHRELAFKKQATLDQLFIFSNFIISVILAYLYQSVWAMVFGRVASSLLLLLASFILSPYRPRLCLDKQAASNLFNFGKHVLTGEILLFAFRQGDDLIVGKMLGESAVGFYIVAYNLASTPHSSITQIVSRVALPIYAKLQNDLPELKKAYCTNLKLTATLAMPLCFGLFILASDSVSIIYGAKWLPMVPTVQVLCVYGLIRVLGATTSPIFQGLGQPKIISQLFAIKVIVMLALIWPLTMRYGYLGTSVAVTIAIFIGDLGSYKKVCNILNMGLFAPIKSLYPSVLASVAMSLCVIGCRDLFEQTIGIGSLLLLIVWGGITFCLPLVVLDRTVFAQLRRATTKST